MYARPRSKKGPAPARPPALARAVHGPKKSQEDKTAKSFKLFSNPQDGKPGVQKLQEVGQHGHHGHNGLCKAKGGARAHQCTVRTTTFVGLDAAIREGRQRHLGSTCRVPFAQALLERRLRDTSSAQLVPASFQFISLCHSVLETPAEQHARNASSRSGLDAAGAGGFGFQLKPQPHPQTSTEITSCTDSKEPTKSTRGALGFKSVVCNGRCMALQSSSSRTHGLLRNSMVSARPAFAHLLFGSIWPQPA